MTLYHDELKDLLEFAACIPGPVSEGSEHYKRLARRALGAIISAGACYDEQRAIRALKRAGIEVRV